MWLLDRMLAGYVSRGELTVVDHKGRIYRYASRMPGLFATSSAIPAWAPPRPARRAGGPTGRHISIRRGSRQAPLQFRIPLLEIHLRSERHRIDSEAAQVDRFARAGNDSRGPGAGLVAGAGIVGLEAEIVGRVPDQAELVAELMPSSRSPGGGA